jgi:hypothetical protein
MRCELLIINHLNQLVFLEAEFLLDPIAPQR